MALCDLCMQLTEWIATLDSSREGPDYEWMRKVWVMPATTETPAGLCHFCLIWMTEMKRAFHWHYLMLRRFHLRAELWCFPQELGQFPFARTLIIPMVSTAITSVSGVGIF